MTREAALSFTLQASDPSQWRHYRIRLRSPQQADAWYAAGVTNGGTCCEDPPGVREIPTDKFYVAYLCDLDGNKLCALHRIG
jgi:hypothetical protein